MTDTALASPLEQYATVTETALILHAGTPLAAWEEIGRSLGRMARSSKWLLADWLVQGEALYGELYAQGMDATGLSYQTLMNLASISRRVPPEVRRGDLSHAHHAEVSKFDTPVEQAAWLQRAVEQQWTVKELREAIRGPREEASPLSVETACPFHEDENDLAVTITRLVQELARLRAVLTRFVADYEIDPGRVDEVYCEAVAVLQATGRIPA